MLKAIVQQSEQLIAFISALNIVLYQPQIRHLTQILDALLECSNKKTLTNLYRQFFTNLIRKRRPTFSGKVPGRRKRSPSLASTTCCRSSWKSPGDWARLGDLGERG